MFAFGNALNDRLAENYPDAYAGMFSTTGDPLAVTIAVVRDQNAIREFVIDALAGLGAEAAAWAISFSSATRTLRDLRELAERVRRESEKIMWRARGLEVGACGIDTKNNAVAIHVIVPDESVIRGFLLWLRVAPDALIVRRVRARPEEKTAQATP